PGIIPGVEEHDACGGVVGIGARSHRYEPYRLITVPDLIIEELEVTRVGNVGNLLVGPGWIKPGRVRVQSPPLKILEYRTRWDYSIYPLGNLPRGEALNGTALWVYQQHFLYDLTRKPTGGGHERDREIGLPAVIYLQSWIYQVGVGITAEIHMTQQVLVKEGA